LQCCCWHPLTRVIAPVLSQRYAIPSAITQPPAVPTLHSCWKLKGVYILANFFRSHFELKVVGGWVVTQDAELWKVCSSSSERLWAQHRPKEMRAGRLTLVAVILIICTCFAFCANLDYMTLSDKLVSHCRRKVGRDSSARIAARYDWMVRGSKPGWCEIFRTRQDWPCGPPNLIYKGYRVFPRDKAAGAWRWPYTPSNADVKQRVQLYLYSTSGTSWPVLGWTLPFAVREWRELRIFLINGLKE